MKENGLTKGGPRGIRLLNVVARTKEEKWGKRKRKTRGFGASIYSSRGGGGERRLNGWGARAELWQAQSDGMGAGEARRRGRAEAWRGAMVTGAFNARDGGR